MGFGNWPLTRFKGTARWGAAAAALILLTTGCGGGGGDDNGGGGGGGGTNVTLSGTLRNATSPNAPISGITVQFNGQTEVTGGTGAFSFNVPAGTTSQLRITAPAFHNTVQTSSGCAARVSTDGITYTVGQSRDVTIFLFDRVNSPPPPPCF